MTTSISKDYPHTDDGYLFDTGSVLGAERIAGSSDGSTRPPASSYPTGSPAGGRGAWTFAATH